MSDEELAQRLAVWRDDPKCADLVKAVEAAMAAPPVPTALPDQWLDSDEVLAIDQTVEPPEALGNSTLHRHLSLECSSNPPARWHVSARSGTNTANRLSWTVELDAQTGELLREVLSRPGEGRESWIIRPWRERIAGGPWKNI
jgi:hypothetical protein